MPTTRPALSYRLLSLALLPVWIVHAAWQAFKNKPLDYFWQRLGNYPDKQYKQSIWLHAASVGEVELIKPLVEILHKNHQVLVTTFTVTGYQHAVRSLPASISITALPIDFLPISRHFIRHFSIKLALVAETELWPETLYQASKKGIPLVQVNARLSTKSLHTAGWINKILKTTLGYFDRHLTRTEQDVDNLLKMGVDQNNIRVTGNLKFSHSPEEVHYDKIIKQPYILCASTHFPEEELLAKLLTPLSLKHLIVIAPRHPQRAAEILKSLEPLGLKIKQRSLGEKVNARTQIYLADTLGELKNFMAHAELVIMGGSFNQTGGHNVLEPARLAKAIITGPSDHNIQQDLALLLEHEAIIQVKDIKQLGKSISFLLDNPKSLKKMGKNARKIMQSKNHILDNYLRVINSYL